MDLHIAFDNSYARLPDRIYAAQAPTPVRDPQIVAVNDALAQTLGIDPAALRAHPDVLAGNSLPAGATPIAQAYGGHQFGHWNPGLGDGRAILMGEVIGRDGIRRDIVLKGSGPTPYSRAGDGRAWLGPVLREYLVSEAMAAMGVPTTRALAAVTTGETVLRDRPWPGAILTRVAQSHIRVGTFQRLAAQGDLTALAALTDYTIERHYPGATSHADLLASVTARQARLIAQWMGTGFVHGVMNTDNCAISGETIDYGPCAFIDSYHPMAVYSSIDHAGRYAYGNQPQIALWNLAQFATALIALAPDRDAAIDVYSTIINGFADDYEIAWLSTFGAKLGLADPVPADRALIEDLLALMAGEAADFTTTFATLATSGAVDRFTGRAAFAAWQTRWQARAPDPTLMARSNPQVIPRTHLIEAAIAAAVAGDLDPFHRMLAAVTRPFAPDPAFMLPPTAEEIVPRTFCGT